MIILGVAAILALVISGFASVAFAAGSDSGSASGGKYKSYGVTSEMRKAIALVKQEAFADALPFLQKEAAGDPGNADAWNLIGFSSRNPVITLHPSGLRQGAGGRPKAQGRTGIQGRTVSDPGNLRVPRNYLHGCAGVAVSTAGGQGSEGCHRRLQKGSVAGRLQLVFCHRNGVGGRGLP